MLPGEKRPNFREDEPLLRTKIGLEGIGRLSQGPLPVADFREIFAVFGDVEFVALHQFGEALGGFAGDVVEARDAIDDIKR